MQQTHGEQISFLLAAENNSSGSGHSHASEPLRSERGQACHGQSDRDSDYTNQPTHVVSPVFSSATDVDAGEMVPQPPDSSNPIPRALSFSYIAFITDTISVLSSVPFIVLACLLARISGRPVHEVLHQNYENGIRVAATALPIVFAAVFGRLATQVSRWRLERGASLPSIEQWLGSRTVFSALLTQIRLGGLNTVGLLMTTVWALSPLGAQSILRVLGTMSKPILSHEPTVYFDTNTPPFFTELFWEGSTSLASRNAFALTSSIYAAAMLSEDSTKSGGQDSWGNVKIPFLSSYANNSSDNSWVKVPHDDNVVFSSLVGLPAASVRPGLPINYTFSMESSYIELKCSSFVPTPGETDDQWWNYDINFDNTSLLTLPSSTNFPEVPNGTWQACLDDHNDNHRWIVASDAFVDPLWLERKSKWVWSQMPIHAGPSKNVTTYSPNAFVNETNIATSQARLFMKISESDDIHPFHYDYSTTCWISQPYVESQVECSRIDPSARGECSVTAQRSSQKPHASTNITHLSFPWVFSYLSGRFPNELPNASLLYLLNTSSSFILDETRNKPPGLDNITSSVVSYRLGQLINSYLIASQAYDSIPGGILSNYVGNLTTLASMSTYGEEICTISTPWLTISFITALAIFLGSIAGAVFCHASKTPEILGFASSAIRDSKYVNLAPGFGGLGGLEMTKAFEGIEFRYGVVGKMRSEQAVLGVSWKVNVKPVEKGVPYV